jgi:hypothetical protein
MSGAEPEMKIKEQSRFSYILLWKDKIQLDEFRKGKE